MAINLEDYAQSGPRALPDEAKDWVDAKVGSLGSKIYRGALQVAASGFGKGVLVGLGVAALSVVALGIGFASGGLLPAAPSLAVGVSWGVNAVASFLMSWTGIVALGAAGAVGAVADTVSQHHKLTAEMVQERAEIYKQMREQAAKPPELGLEKIAQTNYQMPEQDLINHCSHCAREMERRQQAQATTQQRV